MPVFVVRLGFFVLFYVGVPAGQQLHDPRWGSGIGYNQTGGQDRLVSKLYYVGQFFLFFLF